MYRLHEFIPINASAQKVWNVLSDFDAYPEWNPFIREIKGSGRVGEKLKVTMSQPGSKPMTFKPKLVKYERGRTIGWLGHLGIPGLFDGHHDYTIDIVDEEHVVFHQIEEFRGLLIPLFKKMIENKTRVAFASMNKALKEKSET